MLSTRRKNKLKHFALHGMKDVNDLNLLQEIPAMTNSEQFAKTRSKPKIRVSTRSVSVVDAIEMETGAIGVRDCVCQDIGDCRSGIHPNCDGILHFPKTSNTGSHGGCRAKIV
jgi:hypothetical protein